MKRIRIILLELEGHIFIRLLRRHVNRLTIEGLDAFVSWFGLDRKIKELKAQGKIL